MATSHIIQTKWTTAIPKVWREQPVNMIVVIFSIPMVFWLGWNSINFYSYQRAYTDAGVFQAVANHIAQGKTLYANVWDHKPPLIYYLNLIPIYFGDGSLYAVRFYERIFITFGLFTFYLLALLISRKPLLPLLFTFVFQYHFFTPELFQGGNLTEEYASFLILFGITPLLIRKYICTHYQPILILFAGIFFSLAAFTKEPFLLSVIPWFLYIAFEPGQSWNQKWKNMAWLVGGFLSVYFIFVVWFWMQGNLDDWWQVIQYNRAYVEFSQGEGPNHSTIFHAAATQFYNYTIQQSWIWFFVFCLGCSSVFYFSFVKKLSFLPVVFLFQFLLEQLASNLSGFDIGHYYLQYTASYCLVGLCGVCAVLHILPKQKIAEWILAAILIGGFTSIDQSKIDLYKLRMNTPYREADIGILSKTLRDIKKDGDTLWTNLGEYSKYYAESGLVSPCPYIYAYEHLFIDSGSTTAQQKRDALTACLQANPPTYMILSDPAIEQLEDVNLFALREWIRNNYIPNLDVTENGAMIYVYQDQ